MSEHESQGLLPAVFLLFFSLAACQWVAGLEKASLPSLDGSADHDGSGDIEGEFHDAGEPEAANACMLDPCGFKDISASQEHTCALLGDGRVQCWGHNDSGQLGDGTTGDSAVPRDVIGPASGAAAVAAGLRHACALLDTGSVVCWGSNEHGQLGDGTADSSSIPVNVSGLTSGVSAVTAGDGHTCALLETGGVVCWGDNEHGQLGDGTIDSNAIPVNVSGLTSGVSAVTAGGGHTCALMGSGGIRCWGINDVGQVGNDESDSRFETPQDVAGLGSAARTVDAGANHTCALLESGGAVCWGDNADRQVGTGESVVYYNTPQAVRDLDAGVAAVTAGGYHSCALLESGRLTCWGKNGWGQLGDGTTNAAARPKDADDRALGPSRISAGGQHTCAVYGNGCALCWGLNDYGQLGDGREVTVVFPMDVTGGIESAIVTSSNHTCALSDAGGVQCWGGNYAGQLGTGTRAHSAAPGDVSGLDSGVTDVSAGSGDTCVVMAEGSTWCWGDNIFGQLGDGTMMSSITPVRVEDLPSAATAVSIGVYHACAILDSGGLMCWGNNTYGQLGDGPITSNVKPVRVEDLPTAATAVSVGALHTCAILDSGGLMCWGNNTYGQLGIDDPSSSSVPSPRDVYGLSAGVAAVAAGESHTCALLNGGDVMCWGKNSSGQLGDGTTERRSTPVVVPEELGMTAIAADNDHTCAIMSGGGVKCWGLNDSGQLGDGTLQNSSSPRSVQGLESGVKAIGCGQGHTCAVRSSGDVVCWGSNQYGQVSGLFPGYPHLVVCL